MKLNYKNQMIISIVVILLANVLSTIFKHWVYRSAGFVICGLLWIIHPVLPKGAEVSKRTLWWVRFAGLILILIGVFTRVYIY
ncbi:MAG: hypothetical protein E7616_05985 [Ruminococcaceae bacterium]|nr:hypothetical protein [Oscillospiraceae bacterium]